LPALTDEFDQVRWSDQSLQGRFNAVVRHSVGRNLHTYHGGMSEKKTEGVNHVLPCGVRNVVLGIKYFNAEVEYKTKRSSSIGTILHNSKELKNAMLTQFLPVS
jgi:hypothetical protein